MMIKPEVFEEYGKKRLRELLEKGERPVIVAGFIDFFGNSRLVSCLICHVPVWVRPWIFEAMVEYDLKVVCVCCADPFEVRGQIVMDFAKIEAAICVICGKQYEAAAGRTLTCSDECHENLVEILVQKFGEYKKVCSVVTGKCYRVPTRVIIERGITHEDLVKSEWKEEMT